MTETTSPDTFGLFAAWAGERLAFQTCRDCNTVQHPPGHVCSSCRSTRLAICDVSGDAEVVAWSIVRRAPAPQFATEVPYVLAVVRLVEEALVEVRLIDARGGEPSEVPWRAGDPVRLELGKVGDRPIPVGVRTNRR